MPFRVMRFGPLPLAVLIVRDELDCLLSGCISTLSSASKPECHFLLSLPTLDLKLPFDCSVLQGINC